jgi:hypothetical protein
VKFDQLTKNKLRNFNQTPKLTENFDQLKMSSEIRSTDRFPPKKILFVRKNLFEKRLFPNKIVRKKCLNNFVRKRFVRISKKVRLLGRHLLEIPLLDD